MGGNGEEAQSGRNGGEGGVFGKKGGDRQFIWAGMGKKPIRAGMRGKGGVFGRKGRRKAVHLGGNGGNLGEKIEILKFPLDLRKCKC